MSRPKPKDKKADPSIIEKQFEIQKRDIIDQTFTIKHLEQKLAEKVLENERLTKELEQVHMVDKQKIKILNERTEDDQKRLSLQINRITDLEISMTRFESMVKSLNQELSMERESREKQNMENKIRAENQRRKARIEIDNLQFYAENKEKNELELLHLTEKLEYERSQKTRELADKEREKVQATDKLRDQMLRKIREMRTNLLSLKKEQLSTTTRLTILQNHQLTSELEYQSKQTEKLIFKEEEMQDKIKTLTQQLTIHKEVEEQLAKRAHFSKGVIKKLTDRVAELERQNQESVQRKSLGSGKSSNECFTGKSKLCIDTPGDVEAKQMLIEIEKQLETTEKKYTQAQSKLQSTEKQRNSLANQLKRYEASCNTLTKVLIAFSDDLTIKKSMQLDKTEHEFQSSVLKIDLEELRNKKTEEWSNDQISLIVKILLNLVKPYLTKKNIVIPAIRKLLVIEDSKLGKSESKLPKLVHETDENQPQNFKDIPINLASKIVTSSLRQWGSTVNLAQNPMLRKKYKVTNSNR